jgi:4-carboxymuconolactone decarboxylase
VIGLPRLRVEYLSDPQRHLYDAVVNGPRSARGGIAILVRDDGTLTGPFDPWMRSPSLGDLFERVGLTLRTEVEISADVREIAILVVARAWGQEFEWAVHSMLGLEAGLSKSDVASVEKGEPPTGARPAVIAAYRTAHDLVQLREISPAVLESALITLGERALVEVVMTVGFYQLVSATLATQPSAESSQHDARRVTDLNRDNRCA